MGNCTAQLFAHEGATVILTDIDDQVWDCVKLLQQNGYPATAFQADLSQLKQVKGMVDRIVKQFGRIDILVNVAGKSVHPRPPFLDMTEEYWNMVMDRNLGTCLNCCWAVLPIMVKQKYGKVINFSSITGTKVVYRHCAAYAASKGAVSALTRALALEMGEHNITVNAILPGDIDTGDEPWRPEDGRRDLGILAPHLSCPLPRPGKAEEVAALALYLASEGSSFITGAELIIDGGATIVEPYPGGPQ
jgi:NAD(P)-dependent dehydrogenase (short-subunit alcohol dehydrogenase family)